MIRVAIVDDEVLVRSGFEMILGAAADIEVVAAVDGQGALAAIDETAPDVVLLDLRMPVVSGLDVLDALIGRRDAPTVAVLTTFDTDEHISHALRAGAQGFIVKDTDPEELHRIVRSLAAGSIVLSPQVSRTVIDGYLGGTDRQAASLLETLTERERQVLARLARGESNSEIGSRLHLSVGTIKDHVSAILAKLGVATRLEAALIADRGGLAAEKATEQ